MADYEGLWDCPQCGTKGLRGLHDLRCPNCGRTREGVKFYLPEDAPALEDQTLIDQAHAGADWVCLSCNTSNRAGVVSCEQCGASRGSNPGRKAINYSLDQVPRGHNEVGQKEFGSQRVTTQYIRDGFNTASSRSVPIRHKLGFVAVGALILVAVASLLYLSFDTFTVPARVTGFTWSRQVFVEEVKTVEEDDWSVPSLGREIRRYQAIHHYNPCSHIEHKSREVSYEEQTGTRSYVCGKQDNGNGSFSDEYCTEPVYTTKYRTEYYTEAEHPGGDPVYATKYSYNIERWVAGRTRSATGNNHEPYWPVLDLHGDGSFQVGNERKQGSKESYVVVLLVETKKPQTIHQEVPINLWSAVDHGQAFSAQVNHFSRVLKINWPESP